MAEEDAEIAVLRQLQAGHDYLAENDGANSVVEGSTEDNNHEEQKVEDAQSTRVISPSSVPTVTVAGEESRSSSIASSRKPKIVGGFLADDSDEEGQAPTPSPLRNSVAPAENGTNGDSTTGAVIAPSVTSASSNVQAPPTASAPKARLPHDKVGILEDRIVSVSPTGNLLGDWIIRF